MPDPVAGFERILVATGFGLEGDRAIRRAARLPLEVRATVVILHVLPGHIPRSAASVVTGAAEQELDAARQKLEILLERRGRHDVVVRTRLARGDAAAGIGRVAGTIAAELVVVGRGGSRLSGTLLGSTAQRVARDARVPVLLVRRQPTAPYRRVVVGFDESPDALRAARLARRLTAGPGTAVFVVHAYQDPRAELGPTLYDTISKETWKAFTPVLANQVRRARKLLAMIDPVYRWTLSFKPGDPRRRLLEAAQRKRADLVVVGSRSRRGLPRLVLGSVAEAVLNQAPCDVLISPRRSRTT